MGDSNHGWDGALGGLEVSVVIVVVIVVIKVAVKGTRGSETPRVGRESGPRARVDLSGLGSESGSEGRSGGGGGGSETGAAAAGQPGTAPET